MQVVARLRARCRSSSDVGLVNYVIQPGETPQQNGQPRSFYSRIDERNNEMVLLTYRPHGDLVLTYMLTFDPTLTYRPLDYEALPSYTLTVKAAVSNLRHVTMLYEL